MIHVELLHRPFIAMDAIIFYVQKLFIPYPLLIDYGRSPTAVLKLTNSPELLGFLGWATVGAVLLVLASHRWQTLGLVSLFLAALLPNLGLIPFAFQGFSTVADRYVGSSPDRPCSCDRPRGAVA